MSTAAVGTHYTPNDLLELPDAVIWELVDGELVQRIMSELSSFIGGRLVARLTVFCEEHDLGWVFPADAGYQCFPDNPGKVRKPDVSFISKDRLPNGPSERGFSRIAPDLAVEVISPNELALDVDKKIHEYLEAGVQLVWKVNPDAKLIAVHRASGSDSRLGIDDELSGENVIPGFRINVGELFATTVQ